jgi:TPR repeat protein
MHLSISRGGKKMGQEYTLLAMGNHYATGDGVEQNYEFAVKCWLEAANMGSPTAMFNLGVAYANGDGVDRDMSEAERWLREAEAHGAEGAAQALAQLGL